MFSVARIRQLAKNQLVVQFAEIERLRSIATATWFDGPTFATEQEAELYARGLYDKQSQESPGLRPLRNNHRQRGAYWLWPTHSCRVPLI